MYEQHIGDNFSDGYNEYARSYSRKAEWFVFFVLLFALMEAVFFGSLQGAISERSAWWARLTPWKLYPTEILFFCVIFLPSCFVVLRGRKFGYDSYRGFWLVAIFLLVGILQAIHGWFLGGRKLLWLADLRQFYLMSIFVPFFSVLASGIRLSKLADRLCNIGLFLAIYSGVSGVLVFSGLIQKDSLYYPGQWSQQTLVLLYLFVLTKSMVCHKVEKFKLLIFAFGILAPLQKTPTASFIVLHLIALYMLLFVVRYKKKVVVFRTTKVFVVMGICLVALLPVLLGLGGGAAKRWLSKRWLKTDAIGADLTSGRLDAWQWGIKQWENKPLFGNGLGYRKIVVGNDGTIRPIGVHNIAVTLLYQTGLVGFMICISIFLVWFVRMKHCIRNCFDPDILWPVLAMFIFCLTIIIASLAGRSITIPYVGFVFWICFAFMTNAESQYFMESSAVIDSDSYSNTLQDN